MPHQALGKNQPLQVSVASLHLAVAHTSLAVAHMYLSEAYLHLAVVRIQHLKHRRVLPFVASKHRKSGQVRQA